MRGGKTMKKLLVFLLAISGLAFGLSGNVNKSVQSNEDSIAPVNYTLDDPDELPFPIGLA